MSQAVSVELDEVSRSFRTPAEVVWAVRGLNLRASAGEFVCIYGPSGSGKSTLVRLITGLDRPDSGEITVAGRSLVGLDEAGRGELRLTTIGVAFQNDALLEEFSAAENVALPLEARGMATDDALAEAGELLDRVGLERLADRRPAQLSGGQRQRVGIARALAGDREILVADEPTGALDRKASTDIFQLMRNLCDQGALVIVCSHDPLCLEYATTAYEMNDGRLRCTTKR
ncbi:ABC transporter ATP-binding protein [Kribbella sp. NBC_01505]|uniref:ABC transporter ATP-binding protein n=1 Tax=Kribbella sp. NBC_01505 TaxID=2903580 RepID=UPI00386ED4DA